MPQGTIDDLIAETTQGFGAVTTALNALNDRITDNVARIDAEINNLKGQGQPGSGGQLSGIITQPTTLRVASGSLPGTVLGTLAAPMLTNPTFQLVSPSGRYEITGGNQLIVGLVDIDIANGTSDSITVKAVGSDGISQITEVKSIVVDPPSTTNTFDMNFVTNFFVNSSAADITNTQPASITEQDFDGTPRPFGPNAVRQVNTGVKVTASQTEYVGRYALRPSNTNWGKFNTAGPFTPVNLDTTAGAGHATPEFPAPAVLSATAASSTRTGPNPARTINGGETFIFKAVGKWLTDDPEATDWSVRIAWGGPNAGSEGIELRQTKPNVGTFALVFPNNGYGSTPSKSWISILSAGKDNLTGLSHVIVKVALPADAPLAEASVYSAANVSGKGKHVVMGAQLLVGQADKPFKDVLTDIVIDPADDYRLTGQPATYLAGSTGHILIEVDNIDYSSCGFGPGATTGKILSVGNTPVIETVTPTTFKCRGGTPVPMGHGGWRGICRVVVTGDGTATEAYVNGSKVATGAPNAWSLAGVVRLLQGVTGTIRRISGGGNKLSSSQARALSQITNRTFVRGGDALQPGAVTATFIDDFEFDSIMHRTSTVINNEVQDVYAASYQADNKRRWKPRAHFYQHNDEGSGQDAINGEPQHYVDQDFPGSWQQAYTIENGELVLRGKLTKDLTQTQRNAVPNNPAFNKTLGTDPFATTNASNVVTVTDANHGLKVGDEVTFSGATAVNGVTVNGVFIIDTVPTTGTYTFVAGQNATATGSGGGGSVARKSEFPYVSAILTTWGSDPAKGGFMQAGGYWEWRAALPAFPGSWGAIWLYTPGGSGQEIDIEELYGINPTVSTSAYHANNFAVNKTTNTDIGANLDQKYTSYALIWDTQNNKYHVYFDGRRKATFDTTSTFGQYPQYILMNIAIHPSQRNSQTDIDVAAGKMIMKVDRVQAYRFGA